MTPETQSITSLRASILILAGLAQTLSLAPLAWWWLGPISITLILWAVVTATPRQAAWSGWLFGLGLFGSGTSWVYVSIHDYGNTPAPIAAIMSVVFCAFLALFPALAFWLWRRISGAKSWRLLVLFPTAWLFADVLRGWILTGFPWLYAGYGQATTALGGWAPILGVHGVTLMVVAAGITLYVATFALWRRRFRPALLSLVALAGIVGASLWVSTVDWFQASGKPLAVAAVQGNIPQMMKWDPDFAAAQVDTYREMTEPLWGKDLILWPETAIPITQDDAAMLLDLLSIQGMEAKTGLITGIPYIGWNADGSYFYHNSIVALGMAKGMYHKQRLVPFGEYVPLQAWLRGIVGFFDLPMSGFSLGRDDQKPLTLGNMNVVPFICYEIAYADFVGRQARNADLLVTISNDGWFGASFAPDQHLQIAQMRARETARYVLRGTNNGISAVIEPNGQIQRRSAQFQREVLEGEMIPGQGNTPFMTTGSWPIIMFALGLVVLFRERTLPPIKR